MPTKISYIARLLGFWIASVGVLVTAQGVRFEATHEIEGPIEIEVGKTYKGRYIIVYTSDEKFFIYRYGNNKIKEECKILGEEGIRIVSGAKHEWTAKPGKRVEVDFEYDSPDGKFGSIHIFGRRKEKPDSDWVGYKRLFINRSQGYRSYPPGITYDVGHLRWEKGKPITPLLPQPDPTYPEKHGYRVAPGSLDPLPKGISINPDTGEISGTPLECKQYAEVHIHCANAVGYGPWEDINIDVFPSAPEMLRYRELIDLKKGIRIAEEKPTVIGEELRFSVDPETALPKGLELAEKSGSITGTPLEAGEWKCKIVASNRTASTSFIIAFRVMK